MTKYLYLRMDNDETWKIPLSYVIDLRSKYYAEKDEDTTYEEEFEYGMKDSYEGIDWLQNNMNWVDIKDVAVLVPTEDEEQDYQELFLGSDIEIVEEEE